MTAFDETKRDRLQNYLTAANSKKVPYKASPAIFRETVIDTHKTLPVEDWGPSTLPPQQGSYRNSSSSKHTNGKQQRSTRRTSLNRSPSADPVRFESVFKPSQEQQFVCDLATHRRRNQAISEWALLDTFEVAMCNEEREARRRATLEMQASQRRDQEQHAAEKEMERERQLRKKEADRMEIMAQTERFKLEDQQRQAAARRHMVKLNTEREAIAADVQRAKEEAEAQRRADAQLAARKAAEQLEAEKAAAAAKAATFKEARDKALAENQALAAQRNERDRTQRIKDAEMSEVTAWTVGGWEKAAQDAHRAKVNQRPPMPQTMDQIAAKERAAREARLMEERLAAAETAAQEKEAREAAAREKRRLDKLTEYQDAIAAKALRDAAQREEAARVRDMYAERARLAKLAEQEERRKRREQAQANNAFLGLQVKEQEAMGMMRDIGMDETERKVNRNLLEHATHTVREPFQMTAQW